MNTIRILQLTDLHVFDEPEKCLKGIPTRESLLHVVQHIRETQADFDHVVITGDHTHDEKPESYQAVRSILGDWGSKLWQVPGNHDDRDVLRSVFEDRVAGAIPGRITFQFEAGNWLCLGLDTHVPGQVHGQIDQEQIDWIESAVASHQSNLSEEESASAFCVGLFLHHPPVMLGSPWMDAIGLHGMDRLQSMIIRNPAIKFCCCGHVHHESSNQIGQCQVLTTPSTGIQFAPEGEVPNFVAGAPGFRIIELHDASFITRVERLPHVRYIPVDN